MTEMFEATAAYLANDDVRDRFEVAYRPGLDGDGWLVPSKGAVERKPETVLWRRPDAVSATAESVVVTFNGDMVEQYPDYPIVLRKVVGS